MAIKNADLKMLYGRSAGRCALCPNHESVFPDSLAGIDLDNKNISEMAHVIAKKKKGPRGGIEYWGDINSYDNLILLCRNHHVAVDSNPDKFPAEFLIEVKRRLELKVSQAFDTDRRRDHDVRILMLIMECMQFMRLRSQCENLPQNFDSSFFDAGTVFEELLVDFPDARPFFDIVLENNFVDFQQAYQNLTSTLSGYIESDRGAVFLYAQAKPVANKMIIPLNKSELYRDLRSGEVLEEIGRLKRVFLESYNELVSYIRTAYSEVDLYAYKPYKF